MQADAALRLIRQDTFCALIKQQAFCGDTFGIDDLMFVKQQLVVFDKSIIQAIDVFAIHQMFGSHQCFGASCAQFILSLIDKQTELWANNQIMHIVQCARFDHDRCKITCGMHGGLPDPANFLDAFVACEDFFTDF